MRLSASSPSRATLTSYPLRWSRYSSALTMFGSSSAISTLPMVSTSTSSRRGQRSALRRLDRKRETEARAGAWPAFHPQVPAVMGHDVPADVQTETGSLGLVRQRVARLPELVEDDRLIFGADAGTVVAHVDFQPSAALGKRNLDPASPGLAELHRIRQQVQHDLDDPVNVARDFRHAFGDARIDPDPALLAPLVHRADGV